MEPTMTSGALFLFGSSLYFKQVVRLCAKSPTNVEMAEQEKEWKSVKLSFFEYRWNIDFQMAWKTRKMLSNFDHRKKKRYIRLGWPLINLQYDPLTINEMSNVIDSFAFSNFVLCVCFFFDRNIVAPLLLLSIVIGKTLGGVFIIGKWKAKYLNF